MNGQETWSSEWLDLAEMDLGAAEYLLGMRPVPVEIICYHCEQAAEKIFYIPIGIMKKQINLNRKICSHLQRL